MKIVIAGSSGFLGTALRRSLAESGHDVVRLVRRPTDVPSESHWDPYTGYLDQRVISSADVVVNLAGAPTAGNPHSKKWARALRESRVTSTRVLAEAVAEATTADGGPAFLAGNGISFYGDHGDQPLTEDSDSRGEALLTRVARDWQAATRAASEAGARVCVLRTSPVMDRTSPPLKQMVPAWKAGLGARLGDGGQYFPMITLRDWVGAVSHLATASEASGPVNLCCPITPTNAEFSDALAKALGRKRARLAVPKTVLKVTAGAMAPEVLGSVRAVPAALELDGYAFHDLDVEAVVTTALRR